MNFDFNDDQKLLRDEAEKLLAATCPASRVNEILKSPDATWDKELWTTIAELGWLGINIPEEMGGLGLGEVELCALAEQLGRAVAPLPVASSIYQFAEALKLAGTPQQREKLLPELASGKHIGCIAKSGQETCSFKGGTLSGTASPVIDGGMASRALVLATGPRKAPCLVLAALDDASVTRTPIETIDPSRNAAGLTFKATKAEILGKAGDGESLLRTVENRAAVFIAFEQIGGAQKAMQLARDYALERYCFGRPVGSYQAVKHTLADMFVKIELARSNAYLGAWALIGDNPALPRAAAAARVAAADAYWFAAKECVEIFGGIGTTLEAECHLHYRRAKQLALTLGGSALWRERLAKAIEAEFIEAKNKKNEEVA